MVKALAAVHTELGAAGRPPPLSNLLVFAGGAVVLEEQGPADLGVLGAAGPGINQGCSRAAYLVELQRFWDPTRCLRQQ